MLLASSLTANVAVWAFITTQAWLALELTGSAASLGLLSAAANVPLVVTAPLSGMVADSERRGWILVLTRLGCALIAALVFVLLQVDATSYLLLLVSALTLGALHAVSVPSSQIIMGDLVDREVLGTALFLNAAQFHLSRVIGPLVAGVTIAAGGVAPAFLLCGALFVVSSVTMIRLPGPPLVAARGESMLRHLLAGARYIQDTPSIRRPLLLSAVPALLIAGYVALLPLYAERFDVGPQGLAALTGSAGIGAILGAAWMAAARPGGASEYVLVLGLGGTAIALLVFAVSPTFPLSLAALFLLGAGQVAYYGTTNTLMQARADAPMRARVVSLYMLVGWGLIPVGNLLIGIAAEVVGPPVALAAASAISLMVVLLVLGALRSESTSASGLHSYTSSYIISEDPAAPDQEVGSK